MVTIMSCFGGPTLVVMAGNCAVESVDTALATAQAVQQAGAMVQRGGAFKPRTSPQAWPGLGQAGLDILHTVKIQTGLPVITEVLDSNQVAAVSAVADILQIGTRNMYNVELLRAAGKTMKPIVLKRGFAATIKEWLLAAQYIIDTGNPNVILCERGIRTYETATRNTLDISAIPVIKQQTQFPIIVDPSHAAGKRNYVPALAKAAIAAGADGLLIDVHPHPVAAKVDAEQALNFDEFKQLMEELKPIAQAVGRTLTT